MGKPVDPKLIDLDQVVAATGKAGTAILINSQTWHRGAENQSMVPRHTLQISWGRRIIGHQYDMNYQMPEHVILNATESLKIRLGFLPKGAYS